MSRNRFFYIYSTTGDDNYAGRGVLHFWYESEDAARKLLIDLSKKSSTHSYKFLKVKKRL